MYLYLDTTERDSFRVALIDKDKVVQDKTVLSVRQHSEKLLKTINKLLKARHISALSFTKEGVRGRLQGITVVKGPGSFTSLRVGIATANALGFALGVPIVGVSPSYDLKKVQSLFKKKHGKIVLPEYGSEPHITVKRHV